MLLRAYRVSDKVGVVVLKLSAALAETGLAGVSRVTGFLGLILGGLLLVAIGLGRRVLRLLRWLASGLLRLARLIFSLFGGVAAGGAKMAQRTGVRATRGAGTGLTGTMARRAARAEIQAAVAEDPLRAQNRVLSGVVVLLLAALLAVVWWATGQARTAPLPPDSAGLAFIPIGQTLNAPEVTPALPNTPVPTATALPAVLQARGSIAYTVRERGQDDIWALNIGSRTPIRIVNSPADDRDPAWSPDGRRLAYTSRQDGGWDIYIYDLGTGTTTRMTYDLSYQGNPHWSPDGQWLVYESYQGENLDIYVVPVDGSQPAQRVTDHPAPDYAPVWSPDGRRIAFVSLRDGSQDIFVFSLDNPTDAESLNLTNTPERNEDYPAWSPDGRLLAYSMLDEGFEKVFVKPADNPEATAIVMERGRAPVWSPDGASLLFVLDSLDSTQLMASPFTDMGISTLVIGVPPGATHPTWTSVPLPASLVNSGGLPLGVAGALYVEQEKPPDSDGLYRLDQIGGAQAPSPYLNERVNNSFIALRQRTLETVGWDFLGELEDAFWQITRPPQPGEERRNWYMTGRQFGFNRNLTAGFPARIELVREDIGVNTYWRVFVRVADEAQSGQLGEPLRRLPWDMLSRDQGDVLAYDQGGRYKTSVPAGYYVDFTQLALDFGWQWVPAGSDWRANINSVNYWLFRKPDGLDWYRAMRELYTDGQLGGFAPTPTSAVFIQPPPTTEPGT